MASSLFQSLFLWNVLVEIVNSASAMARWSVSILVFMECARRDESARGEPRDRAAVSILVFMECARRAGQHYSPVNQYIVSILVFMECARRAVTESPYIML